MDETRIKRYIDKVKLIEKRIEEFEEWKHDFFFDEKTKLACYKALQEIIEACSDIVAMIVKDIGMIPKDDYENIKILENNKIISVDVSKSLKELNGLRNRIVHEYNGLDDEIALASAEELIPFVKEFLESVKKWIGENI